MVNDLTPTQEPMRPRRRPRRMRPAGRVRQPFHPDLTTVLQAADCGDLRRNKHGRYIDTSGRPVDQAAARDALNARFIFRPDWSTDPRDQTWVLTASGTDQLAAL
ncbi:hypothetical protein BBK14_33420 [Parafrankia soli]|uniref:Uncharacterized protein n=1 Tax=Parafrankia soli TaxID=2599596 RepID=A0A1S1QPM6_9ACTN|nr:hypothetical protein [Parafrankia soli]OHV35391.1 hypothetical protein BBK14_33420 [Parafrankia soli]